MSVVKLSAALLGAGLLAGCASKSENISAAYVSPTLYEGLSCPQLREEAARVSARAAQAAGEQDSKATKDAVVTTVGAVVFWPALFFVSGDGPKAAEVSRLKGEMDAIEQASVRNRCGINFQRG